MLDALHEGWSGGSVAVRDGLPYTIRSKTDDGKPHGLGLRKGVGITLGIARSCADARRAKHSRSVHPVLDNLTRLETQEPILTETVGCQLLQFRSERTIPNHH